MNIGLQLWSIHEEASKDLLSTLEKVAKMGYDGVEFAGYFGHSAQELKEKLAELGLKVAASHVPYEALRDNFEETIKFEVELGNKYVVIPYATFETVEEWLEFVEVVAKIREQFDGLQLKLVYHNHFEEFQIVDGEFIMDKLINAAGMIELDVYWAEFSKVNPSEYLAKFNNISPLVHMKDMADCRTKSTILGTGIIDFKPIIKQARENGAEWLIVEQEAFDIDPLDSVAQGVKNLKELLK